MSTTQFSITGPSDVTFTVGAGTLTISKGETSITIDKDSGTRRLSVITDGGTMYFVEEEGSLSLTNNWPTFVMPFLGLGNCILSMEAKSVGTNAFVLIGTDDIRNTSVMECHDALWNIHNEGTTKNNFVDLKIVKIGASYTLRVKHSLYLDPSEPSNCSVAGSPLTTCIRKH